MPTTPGVSTQPIESLRSQAAQRVAALQMSRLMRKARTHPQRFAAAEDALERGDLGAACLIYRRLAVSRPPTSYSAKAQARLRELQGSSRQELREVDARLTSLQPTEQHSADLADVVLAAFSDYEELSQRYAGVPVVNKEISRHVNKQKRNKTYIGYLKAGEAHRLLNLGYKYEAENQTCCAYQVYEQAAQYLPALDAVEAKERIDVMKRDAAVVASVAECRELQAYHAEFERAELLALINPDSAAKCYSWICQRTANDSSLFLAASDRLKILQDRPSER